MLATTGSTAGQQFQRLEVRLVVVLEYHPLHPFVCQRLELHDDLVRRADQPAFRPEDIGHGTRVVLPGLG